MNSVMFAIKHLKKKKSICIMGTWSSQWDYMVQEYFSVIFEFG